MESNSFHTSWREEGREEEKEGGGRERSEGVSDMYMLHTEV